MRTKFINGETVCSFCVCGAASGRIVITSFLAPLVAPGLPLPPAAPLACGSIASNELSLEKQSSGATCSRWWNENAALIGVGRSDGGGERANANPISSTYSIKKIDLIFRKENSPHKNQNQIGSVCVCSSSSRHRWLVPWVNYLLSASVLGSLRLILRRL